MTEVPEPHPAPTTGLEVPEAPSERPRRQVPEFLRRASWRFYLFSPVLVVLVVMVPILGWKGFEILRTERTGDETEFEDDPEAAGFQALVDATPATLLADIGPDGSLQGVTLITLPSSAGGNIIFFPIGTLLPVPLREPPEAALNAIYAEGGLTALEQRIETMLGAAVTEAVEVPRNQWANLVGPVAPLTVQNPTAAETTNDAGNPVAFPEGQIQLTAEQVGLYLQADTVEESDPVRISRRDAFWTAWLVALDEQGPDSVPGEGETGVGGAVRGLIDGPRNQTIIPATPVAVPGIPAIESDIFRPNTLEIVAQVPTWIPFPTGVGRLRTRLVMGVEGEQELLPDAAHLLVQAGAEIDVIANADPFGKRVTEVVYFREDQQERAQRLLDALGVGELRKETTPGDTFDVVVVLGRDYVDAAGGGAPTGTGTVPSSVPTGGVEGNGIPGVTPGEPGGETVG
jgi:hypothetical protein